MKCNTNAQPGTGAASLGSNSVFSTTNSSSLALLPPLSSSLHHTFPIVDSFGQRPISASLRMGILDSSCVAAGPGNTIYAFAQALSYGNSTNIGRPYYVIAKSTNPTAFTEMTWSTVATISASAFSRFDKPNACVVDDQGVVTIFGNTLYNPRVSADYGYMVIRYDPSATPVVGMESTGPGGWMNITVSKYYESGKSSGRDSKAFYVRDTIDGAQKLIHLTSERFGTRDLQFGIVNEKSKTLSSVANWTMVT